MRRLHETRRVARLLMLVLLCSCSAPLPARDGSLVLDSPSLQFGDRSTLDAVLDQPGSDHGGADTIPDRSAEQGTLDKGSPDKSQVPVDPCLTSWSSWSCSGSPLVPGGCVATCGQYVLSCIPSPLPLAPQACTCAKGSKKKTCAGDGLLCDACHDSMKSCCSF